MTLEDLDKMIGAHPDSGAVEAPACAVCSGAGKVRLTAGVAVEWARSRAMMPLVRCWLCDGCGDLETGDELGQEWAECSECDGCGHQTLCLDCQPSSAVYAAEAEALAGWHHG